MKTEELERGLFGKMIDFIVWLMVLACHLGAAVPKKQEDDRG